MSAVAPSGLLSREEMAAVVEELARARRDEELARRLPTSEPGGVDAREALLRRGLERFARDLARTLASRFQRPVELRLLSIGEMRGPDIGQALLPVDRVVRFRAHGATDAGFVLVGRALLYPWLRLAHGSRPDAAVGAIPARAPTAIELAFLRRAGRELIDGLATAGVVAAPVELVGIEAAEALREPRTARLLLASLELEGFGDLGRIRIGLPRPPSGAAAVAGDGGQQALPSLETAVREAPIGLSVEVGRAALPLARLLALAPGEVIALDAPDDGLALVRVDGAAKFRALRGAVNGRLAVRVVEKLEAEEA